MFLFEMYVLGFYYRRKDSPERQVFSTGSTGE